MTNKHMTKEQALSIFKQEILPNLLRKEEENGIKDIPARRFEWHCFIDSLCKNGEITQRQYDTWGSPF